MLHAAEARKYSEDNADKALRIAINEAIAEGEMHIYYPSRLLSEAKRQFLRGIGYKIDWVRREPDKGLCVRISW